MSRIGAHLIARFPALVALPADDDLAIAQFRAFSTQIPILYAILLINAIALAATHMMVAPLYLTVVIPSVLCALCLGRVTFWLRQPAITQGITGPEARHRLRRVIPLTAILGVAFTVWSLSLYPYGDGYAKCHVAFYMSITVISCIFCLMHQLAAALLLTVIVIVPFTGFFVFTGHAVLTAIALNFALVAGGMIFILRRNYRDFANLIGSQRALQAGQQEAERLGRENYRLANLDSLTGLPNRRGFLAALDHALAEAAAAKTRLALALIDLDGFKAVNDLHGHGAGDRVLAEVGERLLGFAGDPFSGAYIAVARLGGDEFGVILTGDPSDDAVAAFGDALAGLLHSPFRSGSGSHDVTGSVGLVVYPQAADTAALLFERADYALYHAKEWHDGRAVTFSAVHETMIRDATMLEHAFRRADLERELSVVFQPIVDQTAGTIKAFEALARWESPELGSVSPARFIPAAERMGAIGRLTAVLLTKALAEAVRWPEDICIAFNLSAHDVSSPQTVRAIGLIIEHSGIDPARIELEITETAVMRDIKQAGEALAALRTLGLRISLDDFGTGFSSLSQVHRLPLDAIKIDRSFIADILTDQTAADLIKTIVALCRSLELECIVEGVETEAQKRRLQALGCRFMQGYHFARPMPAAEVGAYLGGPVGRRVYA